MPSSVKSKFLNSFKIPFWFWSVYFLVLWQILLWAQNPGLMSDDSGEMAAAVFGLGLPHPPGYPFFNLIGHLVCQIPIGAIAFRLNLFSAFLTLLSLCLTLDALRKMAPLMGKYETQRPVGARHDSPLQQRLQNIFPRVSNDLLLAAVGLVFVSFRGVFAQSLTAKGCIYTLTLLFTSVAVWLYVFQQRHPQDNRPLIAVWFLWAIGLANHWQTLILWVPFLLIWSYQKRKGWKTKVTLTMATLVVIGLSLYLYLPLRAQLNCEPCWGYPINLPLFYWVVSRQLVAGVEHWVQSGAFYAESAGEMTRALFRDWIPGFAILSLGGMVLLWKRSRQLFLGLMALFVPVFLGIFAIHEEYNTYLMPVYLVSLAGLLVIFGFVAARWFLESFVHPKTSLVLIGILGLLSAGWLLHVFQLEDKSRYTLAEDFGTNALKGLPKGAILLADGDHYVMPIWYEHFAEGKRPDLIFEPSVFLYHGWGWKQLSDQSEDLKPLVASSNLFQDRLNALTMVPSKHPLFRSLGQEFLGPALKKMPGAWAPRGLVYAWEPRRSNPKKVFEQESKIIAGERLRGLEEFRDSVEPDISTQQIYRYYADQFTALKQ